MKKGIYKIFQIIGKSNFEYKIYRILIILKSFDFNSVIPLDKWKTNILTRIKTIVEKSKTNLIEGGGIL